MNNIAGRKIIISGLVSAKDDLEKILSPIRTKISKEGGVIVGEMIQRRGISRARKSGGVNLMDSPLSPKTYIGEGKAMELKTYSNNLQADMVIFINDLSNRQIETLEDLIEVKIKTMPNTM